MGKKKNKKTKNVKSSTPSGLSISRSRATLTFSWSGGYDEAVNVQYALKYSGSWHYSSVIKKGANATSHALGIAESNYYPSKSVSLENVAFRVQGDKKKSGKTNYTMSSWSGWKYFEPAAPLAPTLTFEKTAQYTTVYTMEIPNHINDRAYWGTHIQYRTVLRINTNNVTGYDVPESAWSSITTEQIYNSVTQTDKTTFTYTANDTNNSATIKNASNAVRWFEARTIGPRGASKWIVVGTSYTEPYPAEIKKAIAKPNSRKGIDCTVNFDYLCSISRPISTMKLQYAFSTPSGVYVEYFKTSDISINSSKTYYSLETTKVSNPTNDDITQYYDVVDKYSTTTDTQTSGIDPTKTYYQAEIVSSPDISDIDDYWECSYQTLYDRVQKTYVENGETKTRWEDVPYRSLYNFVQTIDIEIDSNKSYYTISIVNNPTTSGLPENDLNVEPTTYLERIDHFVERTTDKTIVKGKRYYTINAIIVTTPVVSDLDEYYEIKNINYIEPISPSWTDADIGGDNTIIPANSTGSLNRYSAAISFSIDSEIPDDQLLYVRVNTIYNNQTTNSAYYLCTDDEGKIVAKDNLLTAPTINSVALGDTNHLTISAQNNSEAQGVKIAVMIIPPDGNDTTEIVDVAIPNQNGEVNKTIEIPPKYLITSFGVGIYAFIGQQSKSARITDGDLGYDLYIVNPILKSRFVTYGGDIPVPPTNVAASHIGEGNVLVTWDWNWKEADFAEIAWSDYSDAMDSNEPPTTYQVPNSKNNRLIIRSLETGKTWYFWARLGKGENVSIWSNVVFESLSSSPSIPTLSLSRRYITLDDKFSANWTYVSTDGTPQQSAKICSCTVDGDFVYYDNIIAEIPENEDSSSEAQYIVLDPRSEKLSWQEGQDYNLAVQVTSASGMISEKWSDCVPITVVSKIDSSLESSSLYPSAIDYDSTATYSVGDYALKIINDPEDVSVNKGILYKCITAISEPEEWNDDHWIVDVNQPYQELRSLPLTASVYSSDESANTAIIIERSQDYFLNRPDESVSSGHKGEAIIQMSESDDNEFSIDQNDLVSYLDDGALYYLTTRVSDNYGQVKEVRYEFKVNWTHQALMPVANTTIDETYSVAKISIGTPEVPQGDSITGDVCDIYRKSADGFEILYRGAEFNHTYVDPYPTIGEHGGYRVVYRTRNGDYIAANNAFAWIDLDDDEDMVYTPYHIIDYDGGSVELMYNVDIDNNWRKDFQETHYLGGSIQGDWNTAVSKTTSVSVNVLSSDWETVSSMRTLAAYNGECHVRTRDGSNFLANVEVSEKYPYAIYTDMQGEDTQLCEYSLTITRLDPIEPDGMTLEDWQEIISAEES